MSFSDPWQILVEIDFDPPMRPVLDGPMTTDVLVEHNDGPDGARHVVANLRGSVSCE